MIGLVLWSVAGGFVLAILAAIILNDLSQFKERTIDEVSEFLRPIDDKAVERVLFDPDVDGKLKWLRVPVNYRRKQRVRLDLAGKWYQWKHYRVRILLQWGNTEWHDLHFLGSQNEYTPEALENLAVLRQKGKQFCSLALGVRAKIWALRILMRMDKLRLLPTPKMAPLGRAFDINMPALYDEIKKAAVIFARTYGDDQSEQLAALL